MTLAFWLMFALAAGWAFCAGWWMNVALKQRKVHAANRAEFQRLLIAYNRLRAEHPAKPQEYSFVCDRSIL